ncbi:dol-P-Man:Man(6)GlcNAc(2)-PP-Dol alpha-1,2-mannosyltransferase [Ricinus communis]|uniref:Mannosyltransferase n=1 Tax=Ricinus communis TaxID=3988 RepID=B9SBK6_RICCO|nr:dol-P-Man:Man(6)GlcNAc(2)-PP-Dol alpha-1,2-mannosyltransferase [Ricinus communis]EEF38954.1 glycosyltransferase, putative [Ricinus communis]|eukprot:XP_002523375.1 dol-P-Man:Man(6)GlcNAc(2)-PP-Dol alpha-1,2-mannosyltransferase [Ricinus communis]
MALSTRQRRPLPSGVSSSSSEPYTKVNKAIRSNIREEEGKGLGWFMPVLALGMLRYMSATSNIIHDCDEVFNYWEPLHYLLYKSGFQTWEYSSQFALRSYLYINFHELVGLPASWLYGEDKVRVFYAVRLFLGLISVVADATLVVALSRKYGKRLASYALAMLCLTSGCFFASTSFLPSSFSMYAMSLSSGLFLLDKPAMAVAVAALGVILGWPFSILAFLPITFYSLTRRFKQTFFAGAVTSLALLVLSVLVDHHYYGRWTSSVLNLLVYNVSGGGESHLYGIEGPSFYFRNGFNNFNFCFILALLFLGIFPIAKRKYAPDLLIVVSPLYIWLAFMSLQPHKEERFLYPIYPLVCVAASAVIESFPDLFRDRYSSYDNSLIVMIAKLLRPVVLSLILCASHARTFSLINGYGAPIEVYKILEHYDDAGTGSVLCVGSEWHRFPSSFFVPDYVSEVRWIDDGFRGLLPFPFNSTLGGTAAAPLYFNNKNKAAEEQYLRDLGTCTFLVELQLDRPYPSRGSDLSTWEPIAAYPYLDRELSPPMHRSFFIPYLWQEKNVFGMYKIYKRI